MIASDVVVQPHRRTLSGQRLSEIRAAARQLPLGHGQGVAVAYRPSVGYVLIGGEHRWKAISSASGRVQVIVLRSWDDLVAWMAIDKADGRGLGWDPVAAVYFYEKAVAALKPGRTDQPLADVAEFVGIHRGILESVRWGRSVLHDPDEDEDVKTYVRELLDGLERGEEGGHSVRERVQRFKAKKAQAIRPPQSAAQQRKAFESLAELEGIIEALSDMGPMNPEIPMVEREAWASRLGRLGAPISKIKRTLRGTEQ